MPCRKRYGVHNCDDQSFLPKTGCDDVFGSALNVPELSTIVCDG